ncbi:hypothetical protein M413DRAFT_438825 [Hebeloma cylindrosporum]|uniref:Uncharacterized protein n=1 Tax=Hebeloma cylindrosporum TaxID=76867 RepID=A0A0C3D0P4_HEBCY|nr:hypothetical protein M413DRAFT_438825 [Hebeloma cylindrosporum h7]
MATTFEILRQAAIAQANTISPSFHQDIVALLKDKYLNRAELDLIRDYLRAVTWISDLNAYIAMKDKETNFQHCVRCHCLFSKQYGDGPNDCIIPHVFDADDYEHWGDGVRYSSRCCGGKATIVEETPGNLDFKDLRHLGRCFVGRHTGSVEEAGYNGVNIRPCELKDGECEAEGLDEDEEPIFL